MYDSMFFRVASLLLLDVFNMEIRVDKSTTRISTPRLGRAFSKSYNLRVNHGKLGIKLDKLVSANALTGKFLK